MNEPPILPAPQPKPADPSLRFIIPVGRSIHAIIAGYLGLFALLLIPAPFAVLFGILALRDIKRHPEKIGKGRAYFALVSGGIFTALLLFILLAPLLERR